MLERKGFTLVELMVVILIVAILAAVAIPIMRGRIDAAKWSEGKAMMGTIATSIRAYVAETNDTIAAPTKAGLDWVLLGLIASDFTGTYFTDSEFEWEVDYNPSSNVLTYLITASSPTGIFDDTSKTLNQNGQWGVTP